MGDKEEAAKNAYKEKVFSEHDKSSRASTHSSQKADQEYLKLGIAISDNKELVQSYEAAIENFDLTCDEVIKNETKRMEDKRLLDEAIRENAGKEDLDFFKEPELHTLKRLATFERRGKSTNQLWNI